MLCTLYPEELSPLGFKLDKFQHLAYTTDCFICKVFIKIIFKEALGQKKKWVALFLHYIHHSTLLSFACASFRGCSDQLEDHQTWSIENIEKC